MVFSAFFISYVPMKKIVLDTKKMFWWFIRHGSLLSDETGLGLVMR